MDADFYCRLFSKSCEPLNLEDSELLRDCFCLAVKNAGANRGIAVLATKERKVVLVYDFSDKAFVEGFKGHIISISDEKIGVGCFERVEIPFGIGFVLHIISDEHVEQPDLTERVSGVMLGALKMSEKHLEKSKMVLNALDSINDAISYCDKNGCVRYANKACFEILETNKKELFGQNLTELTSGKPMLLEILKSKKSIVDVEYFVRYKGKKFHFINSGYPVYSEKGEITGAIDIFRSIERSRKLANNMAGYQAFFTFEDIIGESRNMAELVSHAKLFASSDETILVLGESGTGKELMAQAIHNHSDRKEGPFIALNCANFPNELIDSELFGYEEGAFTGAKKGGKQGKFELASGGTLFLDEIGEMQIHLQAKLLRVLETMCISRIGANEQVKVDVRIIAATNRSLEKLVEEGKFRRDLYYRLKVLCIQIPPLRERGRDVVLLAEYFMNRISGKSGEKVKTISEGAKRVLMEHNWPGNVRELENAISRVVFICRGDEVGEKTLFDAGIKESDFYEVTKKASVKISREMLVEAMDEMNGNKKKVAESFGISRPTLYKLLKKYHV